MRQNAFAAAVFPPETLLGELTALPRPSSWICGRERGMEKATDGKGTECEGKGKGDGN